MTQPIIVIPARMAAERLPGKPLLDIAGTPMVVHVWRRAQDAALGPVLVATDAPEIVRVIEAAGGAAVLTRAAHETGSDRVFEAIEAADATARHNIIINLQGDMPDIAPQILRAALLPLADPAVDIATLAARIAVPQQGEDPNIVKVLAMPVAESRLRALYFTRAAAPWGEGDLLAHIGVYAFRRAALARFAALPRSPLEKRERLEQLRALEAGMRIDVTLVEDAPIGVDTPADLARARAYFETTTRGKAIVTAKIIAYQGEPGANSHIACRDVYPDWEPLPCATFEDAFAAISDGKAGLGMIPIENSIAGRVADIHHFLPTAGLKIIGEYFLPIHFQLMAPRGAQLEALRHVHSHIHALGQCRKIIRQLGLAAHVAGDTAGAAREVAEWNDPSRAALAPKLAADVYGLDILVQNVEDEDHNTTRFIILSRQEQRPSPGSDHIVTSFVFRVRNVPAALYKALGGFATNGVNMTKLESYMINGEFTATQFLADVDGHPEDPPLARALEELAFFSAELTILGVYPAHKFREDSQAR